MFLPCRKELREKLIAETAANDKIEPTVNDDKTETLQQNEEVVELNETIANLRSEIDELTEKVKNVQETIGDDELRCKLEEFEEQNKVSLQI